MTKPLAVVAVGGNALILDDQHMALADQYHAVCETATHVATMIAAGWNVVLTHGNGPQVGFILRRSEIADGQVPTVPVQYAVGDTQGAIGFMFQNALGNALLRRGIRIPVVTLVTQTLVDRSDPAFAKPDKPIGSFMTEEVARRLATQLAWTVMEDGNRGWRRAIASPQPVRVIEAPIIERLAREGVLIVACGGGGIAVEELENGELRGVEAVIDKDRAS
ncbi:MAG TPA: carbamate kinase, partial [Caldimonas sp.]